MIHARHPETARPQCAAAQACARYDAGIAARKADVSVYVLGRIETGKGNPGIDAVFRLARALGVQPAELFMDTPPRGSRQRN